MDSEQFSPNELPGPPESLAPPENLQPTLWEAVRGPIREIIETIFVTLIIFLMIRVVIQNFHVEGFSMEPNFHDGQYILVNKQSYLFQPPSRGDVVVLVPPTSADRDYIKRIVGLPGDRIQITNGKLNINDKPLLEPYALNPGSYSMPPTTLAPDHYFVLGDNRDNSSDSHLWGTLERDKIIGKVWLSYWPPKWIGLVPDYSAPYPRP